MAERRFVFATVIAPLVVPAGIFFFSAVMQEKSWIVALAIPISGLFSYASMVVLGLPLFHLLRRTDWLNLPVFVISGAMEGLVVVYIFNKFMAFLLADPAVPFNFLRSSISFDLTLALWGMALSFIVALVFGLIAGIPIQIARHNTMAIIPHDGKTGPDL